MDCWEALFWLVCFYITYKICDFIYRIPRIGSLTHRRIFVTGCDTGFGHEIAKRLDGYGVHVFAGCLTEKGEQNLKNKCSTRLKTVRINVSDPESVRKAYEQVKKQIPEGQGLWGLINNAGICGKVGPAEWLKLKDYNDVFNVNLLGLIDTTVTFLPLIKKAKGRVVNTASVFGRFSLVGITPYCISKYGVEAFSDALRRQLSPFGVSVHLIEPGFHKTNITNADNISSSMRASWDQCPKDIQEEYGEEYLTKSIEEVVRNFVGGIISEKIHDVVDAYEHALIGLFPRTRYVVGKDAKFIWLPVGSLPEWLGDKLVHLMAAKAPKPRAVLQKT